MALHNAATHAAAKKKLMEGGSSNPVPSQAEMLAGQRVINTEGGEDAGKVESRNQLVDKGTNGPVERTSNAAKSVEDLAKLDDASQVGEINLVKSAKTAIDNLSRCKVEATKLAGQEGCNPFLWINENVTPLMTKLMNNAATDADLAAAIQLKVPEKPTSSARGIVNRQIPSGNRKP